MSRSSKGSNFEREICKQLSFWWSGGTADDYFWRTSMSGGRATIRNRSGKNTHGQFGDITATHPRGRTLTKRVTIELKRGYSHSSILDIIEKDNAGSVWWGFFEQAITAADKAGTKWWWLIVKRDFHEPMVYRPEELFKRLIFLNGTHRFGAQLRTKLRILNTNHSIVGVRFKEILNIDPEDFAIRIPK